jgi:hypothetical protein
MRSVSTTAAHRREEEHLRSLAPQGFEAVEAYEPSADLLDALSYVHDAGLVMVAAAGNHASVGSTWPAASPLVISVGASCLAEGGLGVAPYSNVGGDVDVVAPGGCLDRDVNEDGHPDGILGESFALNQPSQLGWYWFEGSSQAAALTTLVVVRLLEDGATPSNVRALLQAGADSLVDNVEGTGAGSVNMRESLKVLNKIDTDLPDVPELSVVLVPWRRSLGTESQPSARILVVDGAGAPVDGVKVYGHFRGTTASAFSCTTDEGVCDVDGEATSEAVAGWTVSVSRVGTDTVRVPPKRAALVDASLSATLDSLASYLSGSEAFQEGEAPVGWYDAVSVVPGMGNSAPSYTFVGGSGIQTSPFGVIASPPLMDMVGTVSTEVVGSGIQTSPFGLTIITLPDGNALYAVEGSGIQTSPFGVVPPVPGNVSCIGTSSCDTSVVLGSGTTVGAVGCTAPSAVVGSSVGLVAMSSSVESESFDDSARTEGTMHDAVPLTQ